MKSKCFSKRSIVLSVLILTGCGDMNYSDSDAPRILDEFEAELRGVGGNWQHRSSSMSAIAYCVISSRIRSLGSGSFPETSSRTCARNNPSLPEILMMPIYSLLLR